MVKMSAMVWVLVVVVFSFRGHALNNQGDPVTASADNLIQLLNVLANGVDECFSPKNADYNAEARTNLLNLAAQVEAIKQDITSRNSQNLTADASSLDASRNAFNEAAPLRAQIFCATKRACLEKGFEGNSKYPRCLPVNGNIHGNVQYIDFEYFLDHALPEFVTSLQNLAR